MAERPVTVEEIKQVERSDFLTLKQSFENPGLELANAVSILAARLGACYPADPRYSAFLTLAETTREKLRAIGRLDSAVEEIIANALRRVGGMEELALPPREAARTDAPPDLGVDVRLDDLISDSPPMRAHDAELPDQGALAAGPAAAAVDRPVEIRPSIPPPPPRISREELDGIADRLRALSELPSETVPLTTLLIPNAPGTKPPCISIGTATVRMMGMGIIAIQDIELDSPLPIAYITSLCSLLGIPDPTAAHPDYAWHLQLTSATDSPTDVITNKPILYDKEHTDIMGGETNVPRPWQFHLGMLPTIDARYEVTSKVEFDERTKTANLTIDVRPRPDQEYAA